ncbi:uncharacterized protein LOC119453331 [Dermacentor silvarum]|uniref:uncharacterized protein LOC119453331 n=1 Tax=Dermacentor silvarum TaxID=543639 RepID=UPI00210159C3|nr:uncharacterized protein LOC119453331 [Dermacentor silvarum]
MDTPHPAQPPVCRSKRQRRQPERLVYLDKQGTTSGLTTFRRARASPLLWAKTQRLRNFLSAAVSHFMDTGLATYSESPRQPTKTRHLRNFLSAAVSHFMDTRSTVASISMDWMWPGSIEVTDPTLSKEARSSDHCGADHGRCSSPRGLSGSAGAISCLRATPSRTSHLWGYCCLLGHLWQGLAAYSESPRQLTGVAQESFLRRFLSAVVLHLMDTEPGEGAWR